MGRLSDGNKVETEAGINMHPQPDLISDISTESLAVDFIQTVCASVDPSGIIPKSNELWLRLTADWSTQNPAEAPSMSKVKASLPIIEVL